MKISLGKNDIITIVGSLLVAVGAFMPMIKIGKLGSISYASAADTGAYVLVAFALAASVLIFADRRKFSLYAVIGAWIAMLWPILKNLGSGGSDDGGMLSKMTKAVADPLEKAGQKIAEHLFSNVLDFEIGGFAFLIGMIVLTVGSVMLFRAAK